jgi:hypothetical protein
MSAPEFSLFILPCFPAMMVAGHRPPVHYCKGFRGYRAIARRRRRPAAPPGGRCAAWIQLPRSAARSARLSIVTRAVGPETFSIVAACGEARVPETTAAVLGTSYAPAETAATGCTLPVFSTVAAAVAAGAATATDAPHEFAAHRGEQLLHCRLGEHATCRPLHPSPHYHPNPIQSPSLDARPLTSRGHTMTTKTKLSNLQAGLLLWGRRELDTST